MLDGKPSREFVFEYKSSGQRYQTSVAVLDWNDHEHLIVIITALDSDFKEIHDLGTSSLFHWNMRKTEAPRLRPPAHAHGRRRRSHTRSSGPHPNQSARKQR